MSLLVDTSVWSLAFRRDNEAAVAEVRALQHALEGGDQVFTTGLVLQELLQGFAGPKARSQLIERFAALGSYSQIEKTISKLLKYATCAAVTASRSEPLTQYSFSSVENTIWSYSVQIMTSALLQNISSFASGVPSDG